MGRRVLLLRELHTLLIVSIPIPYAIHLFTYTIALIKSLGRAAAAAAAAAAPCAACSAME